MAALRARGETMTFEEIDRVIQAHLAELRKPNVVAVRPGYKVTGGWITRKPAIVAIVQRKQDMPPEDSLPAKIDGIAVDVREATRMQQLRYVDSARHAAISASVGPDLAEPEFPYERDIVNGRLFTEISSQAAASAAIEQARQRKPELKYQPPDVPLAPVTDAISITSCASPDAGWSVLQPFLRGVEKRLTVAMYDFASSRVLQTVEEALDGGKSMELVLDRPPEHKSQDDETLANLSSRFGERLEGVWALVRSNPKVAEWIFPTAYHIKVAVRDGSAVWLSSGNWNDTNQPDVPAGSSPSDVPRSVLSRSDRDWHVVVQNTAIASIFEQYIRNDLAVAAQNQATAGAAEAEDLSITDTDVTAAFEVPSPTPKQFFAPQVITGERMTIEPLLTPDNYATAMLGLIQSATQKLYMQLQYIHPETKGALIAAVRDKMRAGVDVRIIIHAREAANGGLERLQEAGLDMSLVKVQGGVHNKGFVVDSEIVAVGSHNWSADGTMRNRDATLIIHHPATARYFEQIFLHDWTSMATQHV
jgi:phosphatidylserine/phosphatidylglycerophosphate/cardiolipin synthase-like enzyme